MGGGRAEGGNKFLAAVFGQTLGQQFGGGKLDGGVAQARQPASGIPQHRVLGRSAGKHRADKAQKAAQLLDGLAHGVNARAKLARGAHHLECVGRLLARDAANPVSDARILVGKRVSHSSLRNRFAMRMKWTLEGFNLEKKQDRGRIQADEQALRPSCTYLSMRLAQAEPAGGKPASQHHQPGAFGHSRHAVALIGERSVMSG